MFESFQILPSLRVPRSLAPSLLVPPPLSDPRPSLPRSLPPSLPPFESLTFSSSLLPFSLRHPLRATDSDQALTEALTEGLIGVLTSGGARARTRSRAYATPRPQKGSRRPGTGSLAPVEATGARHKFLGLTTVLGVMGAEDSRGEKSCQCHESRHVTSRREGWDSALTPQTRAQTPMDGHTDARIRVAQGTRPEALQLQPPAASPALAQDRLECISRSRVSGHWPLGRVGDSVTVASVASGQRTVAYCTQLTVSQGPRCSP